MYEGSIPRKTLECDNFDKEFGREDLVFATCHQSKNFLSSANVT